MMKECGLENELKNDIYYWIKERNCFRAGARCWIEKEHLEYLREAQVGHKFFSKNTLTIGTIDNFTIFMNDPADAMGNEDLQDN